MCIHVILQENDEYIYETMDGLWNNNYIHSTCFESIESNIYHWLLGTEAKLVVKEDKKAEDGKLDSTKVQDVKESNDKETMYSEERVEISFL